MAHSPATMMGGEFREHVVNLAEKNLDRALDSIRSLGMGVLVIDEGRTLEVSFTVSEVRSEMAFEEGCDHPGTIRGLGLASLSLKETAYVLTAAELATLAARYRAAGWGEVSITPLQGNETGLCAFLTHHSKA